MSNLESKVVVCSYCGELNKTEIYTSINPMQQPDIRNKVLSGDIFSFRCKKCGFVARLNYPLLYNDMKNRFMVYLIPKIERFQLCDKSLEQKYSNLTNINKRVVPDFNSFKEKIFIFESGLDDMAVELTKLAIAQTISKRLDNVLVQEGYLSMYDRESNTMGFTYFIGEHKEPYVQTARLEIYGKSKGIIDKFAFKDKKLNGFIKIDKEWAENVLYRYKRAKQQEKIRKLTED